MSLFSQTRRDSFADWTSNNPTPLAGQLCWETDSNRLKIGNGSSAYNDLPYLYTHGATGAGFANLEVKTSGTSWSVPAALQFIGAKWKVTLVGGGGQGGGAGGTAGEVGGGGGSGGVVVGFYTWVAGQTSMSYAIGAAGSGAAVNTTGNNGTDTTTTYNSVTYTASGGVGGTVIAAGGAGGAATGGTLNLAGGDGENGGVMAATSNYQGGGGSPKLGLGAGGTMPVTAGGADGNVGSGYGAGGAGGRCGTATTNRAGGAGTQGVLLIEY
jgi:hypothetical protein